MLVFGAIAPHGGEIIPQLAADRATMAQTREAMGELSRRCQVSQPDVVVVATPHGLIAEGVITLGVTRWAAGVLDGPSGGRVKAVFETDLEFAQCLAEKMEAQNPPVPWYPLVGSEKGQDAVLPLDWGSLVPLWYTAHPIRPRPKVVVLAPDRDLPREILVRAGVAVASAAEASGKRVAFVASCDLGHAHDPRGPYGFDPTSAEHDRLFCQIVACGEWSRLLEWSDEFLEAAKVDAYWQTLMLAGALGHTPLPGSLLSYEAPTYFGMAVAAFGPAPAGFP